MKTDSVQLVLVHGAWHGGWSWTDVPDLLEERGFAVTVMDQLPSTHAGVPQGLKADADAVREAVAAADKPVVLVGHSYGGMVISELAGHPRVVAAMYVAAFLPQSGLSVLDLVGGQLPPWILVDEANGFCSIDPAHAVELMASNATNRAAADVHVNRMVPHAVPAFVEASSIGSWGEVPVNFLVAERDSVIPPSAQIAMAEGAGATITTVDAPHFPGLGDATVVVDFIADAADRI